MNNLLNKEFEEFVINMDERANKLAHLSCPSCGIRAIEPITMNESVCTNCNKYYDL